MYSNKDIMEKFSFSKAASEHRVVWRQLGHLQRKLIMLIVMHALKAHDGDKFERVDVMT